MENFDFTSNEIESLNTLSDSYQLFTKDELVNQVCTWEQFEDDELTLEFYNDVVEILNQHKPKYVIIKLEEKEFDYSMSNEKDFEDFLNLLKVNIQ